MEPMRQDMVTDFPRVDSIEASLEGEDKSVFDSAVGIVVGLGLGMLGWALIVALWLAIF